MNSPVYDKDLVFLITTYKTIGIQLQIVTIKLAMIAINTISPKNKERSK